MEVAILLIATFNGILQGIQTWLQYQDRRETLYAIDSSYHEALESQRTQVIAEKLISIIPMQVIELLKKRVEECFNKFKRMLENDNEYFEEDLNKAAKNALPACVCRNLAMILDISGELPEKNLKDAWQKYQCENRQNKSFSFV